MYFAAYAAELMHFLCTDVVFNPQHFAVALNAIDIPPDLCANYVHPDKDQAIAEYVSRFV